MQCPADAVLDFDLADHKVSQFAGSSVIARLVAADDGIVLLEAERPVRLEGETAGVFSWVLGIVLGGRKIPIGKVRQVRGVLSDALGAHDQMV